MIQKYNLNESDFRGERFKDHLVALKGNNDILSITNPQIIKDIHLAYLDAGADIITTNTFNANAVSMADYGMINEVYEMNFTSARLAVETVAEFDKAEKVVNPPSKPVVKRNLISCEIFPLPASPKTTPK